MSKGPWDNRRALFVVTTLVKMYLQAPDKSFSRDYRNCGHSSCSLCFAGLEDPAHKTSGGFILTKQSALLYVPAGKTLLKYQKGIILIIVI